MPFGIVGWTGPGMRQVVGFGDRSTGRYFWGRIWARYCNEWGLYGVGAEVCDGACGGPRHCCIRWGPRRARGRGGLRGFFSIFTIGNAIGSPTVKCFRFVCENLTTFPLCNVGFLVIYSVSTSTSEFY